jgi:heparan-alpha-glucosaminide N-acetyltransferase
MNTAEPLPSLNNTAATIAARSQTQNRLTSLDVFRGLVILVMTFVNFLSPVQNIPGWAKHMPENIDGYTFVDVVFPGFLFIVGVAIPLALQRRIDRGEAFSKILISIVLRTAGLLFVGVVMVNKGLYSADVAFLSRPLWYLLAISSIVVIWIHCPANASVTRRRVIRTMQTIAAVFMAVLLVLFRGKNSAGETVWMQHSWWGILGMIGWAYLLCSVCWLACRGNSTALLGIVGFMFALYIGGRHGALNWLGSVQNFVNVGIMFGSNSATVMMGVLIGNLLLDSSSLVSKAKTMSLISVALYVSGTMLRPLHGINKSAHTESYALVTGGICCALLALVFYLVEVKGWQRWGAFLIPIGQNALFAYVVPGILGNSFIIAGSSAYLSLNGTAGAWSAALLTVVIMLMTWTLSRFDIKLKF